MEPPEPEEEEQYEVCGEVFYGDTPPGSYPLDVDWSIPRVCALPAGHPKEQAHTRFTEKEVARYKAIQEYRRTHSRDGYPLGSPQYPDNREGRRALQRSWRRNR